MKNKGISSIKTLHNYIIPIILLLFANSTLLFSALSPQQSSTPASVETPTTLPTITPLRADEIKDSNPIERGMNSQSEQTNQGIPTPPPNPTKTTVPNKPPTHIEDNTQARVSIPVQLVEADLTNINQQDSKSTNASIQLDHQLEEAVKQETLKQYTSASPSTIFVSVINQVDDWVFGTSSFEPSDGEGYPRILLFFAQYRNNSWRIFLEHTKGFEIARDESPKHLLTSLQRSIMETNTDTASPQAMPSPQGNGSYQLSLPWATGETQTFTGGLHDNKTSIDFSGGSGNVRAAREGVIYLRCGAGSDHVRVDHPGNISTHYYHLSNISVSNGQSVARGALLGRHNRTTNCYGGAATGDHVHFWHAITSTGVSQSWVGIDIGGWTVLDSSNLYNSCLRRVRDGHQVCNSSSANIYNEGTIGTGTQPNQNPNPPVVNSSITVDYRNIVISWQDGGDPDNGPRNYRDYYVNIWNDGQTWQQGSGWITATSWSVTLPISGRYYVSVQAGDGAGASLNNPVHMIDVILFPHKPTNLVMASRTTSSLTMTWHDNANDEAGYRVYRWRGEDDTWIRMAELGANSTSYTNSNLNCDSPYYYRVSAFNGNRESFIDDWTQGITSACQKPAMPGTPFVTALSTSSASIAWEDRSNNESGFNIYRWGQRNDVWDFYWYASVGSNVTQFIDTNLECKVTYFYFIAAYNEYGESEYTPWTEAPTYECSNIPPNPPDHVTPIYNDIFGPTLYFSWYDGGDPDNGPSQKRQYFVIARNEDYTWYAESGWMSLQYWDVPVPAKGRYYFTVIAYDGAHNSLNNPWYIADTVSLPKEPQVFRVTTTTANSIHLEWYEGSSNTHGYYLYRWRVSDQSWQKITTLEADDLEFTDTNLDCNRLYTYSLSAFNEDGERFVEDPLQANTANCTQAAATATPKPAPTATPKPTPTKTYRIALPFVRR